MSTSIHECPHCRGTFRITTEKESPEQVAERVLGAETIDTEQRQPAPEAPVAPPAPATDPGADDAVTRAQTGNKEQLTRDFRPSAYGYTADMFARQFPSLDAQETLERFFGYHIPKGDRSLNWMQEFLSYATFWQQKVRESREQEPTQHGIGEDFGFDPGRS